MDNKQTGLNITEEDKKDLRKEFVLRHFKEYFDQEAREAQVKREFERNGRDFEYAPDPKPRLATNQCHWQNHMPAERNSAMFGHLSSSSSSYGVPVSPSSSTFSNYFSLVSPISSQSLASTPSDGSITHQLFGSTSYKPPSTSSNHRSLFGTSYPESLGATSSTPLFDNLPACEMPRVSSNNFAPPYIPLNTQSVATQTYFDDVTKGQEFLTSSVFKNAARGTFQGMRTKMHCVFCMKNKDRERVYSSHNLKDAEGRITCPVLRNYVCPNCGATGDVAHTVSYCPTYRKF